MTAASPLLVGYSSSGNVAVFRQFSAMPPHGGRATCVPKIRFGARDRDLQPEDQGSDAAGIRRQVCGVWEKLEGDWKLAADIWNDGPIALLQETATSWPARKF
jgi:hypothetical protein